MEGKVTRDELPPPPADTEKGVRELGIAGRGRGQIPPETGGIATRPGPPRECVGLGLQRVLPAPNLGLELNSDQAIIVTSREY